MALILGIDTSNYTTSAALFDTDTGKLRQAKRLLPVKSGECGIRQSDAVFHHTRQLPEIIASLDFSRRKISAVAVSDAPRQCEGSYMPCFLTGLSTARVLAAVNGIPLYSFSHQQGHIAAAVWGGKCKELLASPFIAFHVSGGTTEALLVRPDSLSVIKVELIAKTLDLNAGQLIDRVGVMLGLDFPCGIELEKLAKIYNDNIKLKPCLKGADCCLSGFENKARTLYRNTGDKAYIAAFTLKAVSQTLISMAEKLQSTYGDLPMVFAGGVMSDLIIRNDISALFDAHFAPAEFSADNAVGIAYLGATKFLSEE